MMWELQEGGKCGNFRKVENAAALGLGSPSPPSTTANDTSQVFPKEKPHGHCGLWKGSLAEPVSYLIPVFLVMQRKQQGRAAIILKLGIKCVWKELVENSGVSSQALG